MNEFIRFRRTGPTAGDETTPYELIFTRPITVEEFMEWIKEERTAEWGGVEVHEFGTIPPFAGVAYSHGTITGIFSPDILSRTINYASCSGGWSRMDYMLFLEPNKPEEPPILEPL